MTGTHSRIPDSTPEPLPAWFPLTHGEFDHRISRLEQTLKSIDRHLLAVEKQITLIGERQVASQADIDALTAALTDLDAKLTAEDSDLNTAVAAIQAWIAAQPVGVDVSGLQAAVGTLSSANDALVASVASAAALVPAPPAPPAV